MSTLVEPWQFAFMQRALVAVLLIALACGPIGALVSLRRLAYAGESLGHALVPGAAAAVALGVAAGLGAAAGALVAALAVALLLRARGEREDVAVALVFSVALAGGVILLALTAPPQRAVAVLFGDVLTVARGEILPLAVAAVVLAVAVAAGWRSAAIALFDRSWAVTAGVRVGLIDLGILVGAALALTTALPALGALLGTALLVGPAAILRPWVRGVGPLLVAAPLIGALVGVTGLVVSYHTGLAAGPAVAVGLSGLFLASWLAAGLRPAPRAR